MATSRLSRRCDSAVVAVSFLGLLLAGNSTAASLQVLAAQYRADRAFPEFQALWIKGATNFDAAAKLKPLETGGAIHIYLRNTNQQPVAIEDVRLDGISLRQAIAPTKERRFKKRLSASNLQFSDLPAADKERLMSLGEPVWWRAEPKELAPGAVGEVFVRLRRGPPGKKLACRVQLAGGASQEVSVATVNARERCVDVCFSPELDLAWLYFDGGQNGRSPQRILLDGEEVTSSCEIGSDVRLWLAPVRLKPAKGFAPASAHCFQAIYDDGATAIATARAFPPRFVYGVWGAARGKEDRASVGKGFVQELAAHNINLQMPGVGSPAVAGFYKSEEGRKLLERMGIQRVVNEVGKGGTERPYAYYLADEPDAADSRVPGVPGSHQVGSLARGLVEWAAELRQQDPLTPQMLNVDLTFPPFNWYEYGQLPDIFAADPYYQPRLREAYGRFRERIPLYLKATFVWAESSICKAASEPRPLHIMLYGNRYEKGEDKFRGPTPPEKRIEAFYAVAAGAKGLSYWWYSPAKPAVGLGAAEPGARALWREVGLLGAELRTAGPLITRSSPLALPVTASSNLWVRTLAVGLDSLLVLVVNDDYVNDPEGTKLHPVSNGVLKLTPPGWMKAQDAFEITASGTKPVGHRAAGDLELELGTVNVTRLVVITGDEALRGRLQGDYETHYAANAKQLMNQ